MPSSVRLVVAAILLVVVSVEAVPAATAASTNYVYYYNQSIVTFQNLKKVADQHNTFITSHKGSCGQEPKAWGDKTKRYVATVKGYLAALWKMNPQQRKKQVFKDLVRAERLLKGWAQGQILAKLRTCKKMPSGSYPVQQGFQSVATDLGIQGGY